MALLNRSKAVATFEHHLYTLRQSGATIVDNLEITNVDVILDPYQSGEVMVMLAEFKLAINDYLKGLITSPVWSLSDVITFNMNNADLVYKCPLNHLTLIWYVIVHNHLWLKKKLSREIVLIYRPRRAS